MTLTPEQADELAKFVQGELSGMEHIELRVAANKIRRALHAIDPVNVLTVPTNELSPMNKAEAEEYGNRVMDYGKFAGKRPIDVEYGDLAWLADLRRRNWRELHRYLLTRQGEGGKVIVVDDWEASE